MFNLNEGFMGIGYSILLSLIVGAMLLLLYWIIYSFTKDNRKLTERIEFILYCVFFFIAGMITYSLHTVTVEDYIKGRYIMEIRYEQKETDSGYVQIPINTVYKLNYKKL